MSDQDKTIKISAVPDVSGFRECKNLIDEMTSAITKMSQAIKEAQGAFGNMGGGGGVTTATPIPGTGNSSVNNAAIKSSGGGGGSGGGIAGVLSKGVSDSANLFKAAATGTTNAFKVMKDALRDSVTASNSEINRLQKSLNELDTTYKSLKKSDPIGAAAIQQQAIGVAQQLKQAQQQNSQGISPKAGGGFWGGGWGAGGSTTGVGGFMNSNLPGSAMTSRLGSMLGISAGMGMFGAVVGGTDYVLRAMNSATTANLNNAVDQPMWAGQKSAIYGDVFGGNALALRHGDLARTAAMMKVFGKGGIGETLTGDKFTDTMLKKSRNETKVGVENLQEGASGLAKIVKNGVGTGMNALSDKALGVMNAVANMDADDVDAMGNPTGLKVSQSNKLFDNSRDEGNVSPDQLARNKSDAFHVTDIVQKTQEAVANELRRNPMYNEMINNQYAGSQGDLDAARAFGVSGKLIKDKQGNLIGDSLTNIRASFKNSGYSDAEGAGMMSQLASTAGFGFKQAGLAKSMLDMTHGGLSNATSLFGLGAQLGDGGSFMRMIQSKTGGGGGLDATAASQLFGAGAGMLSNTAGSNGMGFMSGLADAARLAGGGRDMLGAGTVSAGLGAMASTMAGQTDPLQMALNNLAASNAAPDSSWMGKVGLTGASPAELMQVANGGEMPDWMRMRGISKANVLAYTKEQQSTLFAGYTSSMGKSTEVDSAVERFRKSGNNFNYFKGHDAKWQLEESHRLAEVRVLRGIDRKAARGEIALNLSNAGVLAQVSGKGAHQTASMDTVAGLANQDKSTEDKLVGTQKAVADATTRNVIKSRSVLEKEAERQRAANQSQAGNDNVEESVAVFKAAAIALANALSNMQGGGKKGGPPKTSAHG